MKTMIFSEIFKQTFQAKNWKWILSVVLVLSVITGVYGILKDLFNLDFIRCGLIIIAIFIVVVIVLMMWYLLKHIIKKIHDSKVDSIWGEAIIDLAEAYSIIHEIEQKDVITEQEISSVLSKFCNKIKEIYDRTTKSNSSVSIKVPISNYTNRGHWESMQVKNIARDQKHLNERETPDYKQANHDIIGNTAYSRIVSLVIKESSKDKVYLNNNIDSSVNSNYATTSSICKDREAVPYKSELVVPIIPTKYNSLKEIYFGGFLCIDSDKPNSFDHKRYYIHMTRGLADGLYSLMVKLVALSNQENERF